MLGLPLAQTNAKIMDYPPFISVTGVLSTVDGTPFFLQAEALKPFISSDLLVSTTAQIYTCF